MEMNQQDEKNWNMTYRSDPANVTAKMRDGEMRFRARTED